MLIPDGMCEVWTVECEGADGDTLIDDLVDTEYEALAIIEAKEDFERWTTQKMIVPYKMGRHDDISDNNT